MLIASALFCLPPPRHGLAQGPLAQIPSGIGGAIFAGPSEQPPDVPADLVLQTGHTGAITAMAFGANGETLVTAAEDGHVIVWNTGEGTEATRFSGDSAPVRSIALSADGLLLASGSDNGAVRVWDVAAQRLLHTLNGSGAAVLQVAISPDGRYLVSAESEAPEVDGAAVRLWDLLSGLEITVLDPLGHGVTAVFFTAEGRAAVASAMGDMELRGTLKTFDIPSGRLVATTAELVRAVSGDGRRIAVQHGQWEDAAVAIIDASRGNEIVRFAVGSAPVSLSAEGDWIANIAYPKASVVVNRVTGAAPPVTIQGPNWGFEHVAISPDGLLVATTGRVGGIQLWRTSDGTLVQSLESRPGAASLAWTNDSRTVITAGAELLDWDLETGRPRPGPTLPAPSLGLAVSPDGNLAATGGRSLRVWSRPDGELVREIAATCDVLPLPAFSPDGTLIAGNCRGVVSVWEIATGTERLRFGAYNLLDAATVSFSPDGQYLAASAGPGHATLRRLDASGGAMQLDLSGGLSAVAFSPDRRLVALGTRSQMRVNRDGGAGPPIAPVPGQRAVIAVHELATGRRIFSVPAGDWVTALAFTGDGQALLATAGEWRKPGSVLALESSSGRILRTPAEQVDAESAAAFSPDRAWLAATANSPRGAVKLWKLR